jgi:hypothetical protein
MGAKAYDIIEKYNGFLHGPVVEIGSERGEGSTEYLRAFCDPHGLPFFSVDIDEKVHERAKALLGMQAFCMSGERFLEVIAPFPISFLYLDNFDWIWTPKDDEKLMPQRNRYRELGYEMTNLNSQAAHLRQMELALPLMAEKCVVLLDDTYATDEPPHRRRFDGKGGAVVPYLIAHGFDLHLDRLNDNMHISAVYMTRGL